MAFSTVLCREDCDTLPLLTIDEATGSFDGGGGCGNGCIGLVGNLGEVK